MKVRIYEIEQNGMFTIALYCDITLNFGDSLRNTKIRIVEGSSEKVDRTIFKMLNFKKIVLFNHTV
jgi:hypothetical protein